MARARTYGLLALVAALLATGLTGPPAAAAGQDVARSAAASCKGFKNRVGVTDRYVTIANVSDLSGPFGDLNRSATQAVRAYVKYFNATSSICGRKLKLLALDSRTSAAGERAATITACQRAFAAVGSSSITDDGGAARAKLCGLPDLRSSFSSPARYECPTCFATHVDEPLYYENAVPDFFLARNPAAVKYTGFAYQNLQPWYFSETAAIVQIARGFVFQHATGIDVAEFNYGPHVQALKDHQVKFLEAYGPPTFATRLAMAMKSAAFSPTVFLLDPFLYNRVSDPAFEGAIVPVNFTPFAQGGNAEMARYRSWLAKTSPGARPTPAGVFAWSAARLFTQQAQALGGRLSRPNLVTALRGVHGWRNAGLHATQDVGGKKNANCWRFLKRSGGTWVPIGGTSYRCSGKTAAEVK